MWLPFVCFLLFVLLFVFVFVVHVGLFLFLSFLCTFLATMPFAGNFLVRCCLLSAFPAFSFLSFFFSEIVPGLIWFGSVYLVTTAGFVADPFMWDKQQQQTNKNSILLLTPRANFVSTKCFEDSESTSI